MLVDFPGLSDCLMRIWQPLSPERRSALPFAEKWHYMECQKTELTDVIEQDILFVMSDWSRRKSCES